MNRSVVFVHRGGPEAASYRYRSLIPAKQVSRINGYECYINGGSADILVLSKVMPEDVVMAKAAKKQGCKVVVDFGDDHFNHSVYGAVYHEAAKEADLIVTASKVMADRVKTYTGRAVQAVIPDPYEEEEVEPHAVGNNLLWFGHNLNLPDLRPWTENVKGWDFTVCTGPKRVGDFNCVRWSQLAQTEELRKANVVILPTRAGVENKTNNRLLNTIRSGAFPVCGLHPSYEEFRKLVWVGDVRTGLAWAKAFQDELNGLVKGAQDFIRERYSPAVIGHQWAEVLEAA